MDTKPEIIEGSFNVIARKVDLPNLKGKITKNLTVCLLNKRNLKKKHNPDGETVHSTVKEFVILLDTVEDLARKYRGTYKLHLRGAYERRVKAAPYSRCANSKDLENILLDWEELLNKKCMNEPIIRVENLVDDCPPPSDFEYILENISNCDIREMFSAEYSVGCSCKRCTPKVLFHKVIVLLSFS